MKIANYLIIVILLIGSFACSPPQKDESSGVPAGYDSTLLNEEVMEKYEKARQVFITIPSPIETSSLLKRAGVSFNPEYLKNTDNVSNYETTAKKAINLGAYIADLSYCNVFEQQDRSLSYFNALRILGDELDLSSIFTPQLVERVESNMNDQDSVLNIISEAYWTTKSNLEESERQTVAANVLAGGWIEGLYIASQIAINDTPNELLEGRIAEQKYASKNMSELIRLQNLDGSMDELAAEITELNALFDALEEKREPVTYSMDKKGIISVGKNITIVMTEKQLNEIAAKVKSIRIKFMS
jgi:hypothetical protein